MQLDIIRDLRPALYPAPSPHQEEIEGYFGDSTLREYSAEEKARLGEIDLFFVAFTNRCGSTLLTELLHQTGLPIPARAELLNGDEVALASANRNIPTFSDYFLQLIDDWARNDQAGFKIGARQLFWLTRTGILSNLRSVRVINSVRRDKVAQAVSLCIARETKVWHTAMTEKSRSSTSDSESIEYSRDDLLHALHSLTMSQSLFDYYLNLHALPAIQVEYEQVLEQPRDQVERIITFLNYPGADPSLVDIERVGIRQQRSAVNDRLIAQFRREFNWDAS